MAEQTIIRYMWTTASVFCVFHELDENYKLPDSTGLVSDECYRLIKVPAMEGKCDGEKTKWLLDGGTWGKDDGKEYHAQVWCTEDDSCWPTLEEASKALRQKDAEVDDLRRQATLKAHENLELIADLKAQMLTMRKAVKARYPQYEWIKYGVQDKR